MKYGVSTVLRTILSSKGLRVTISDPRGKKFNPQIASNKDDLPADYIPNTAILGNAIYSWRLKSLNLSIKDIMLLMFWKRREGFVDLEVLVGIYSFSF